MRRIGVFGVVLLGIGVSCVLVIPSRPSLRDVVEARADLYESWYRETKDAYEDFRDLAAARGWKMYVRANDGQPRLREFTSIGQLDWRELKYEPLYEPRKGRFIKSVTAFRGDEAALIECTRKFPLLWGTIKERDFQLAVVGKQGAVRKVPIPDVELGGDIAIGNRYVFFSEVFHGIWLYDLQEGALSALPKALSADVGLAKLSVIEDRFLVIAPGLPLPGGVAVVVQARKPHAEVSRIHGVSNVLVVGENMVVEKEGVCFLYDVPSGRTERLAAGRLVAPVGKNEFLYCAPDARAPAKLAGDLHQYNIVRRSANVIWRPPKEHTGFRTGPGEESVYDYSKVILSPDGHFILVPRLIPLYRVAEAPLAFEYGVYDLKSAQKQGAFLTIWEGQFYFEFLGWAADQGEAPQPRTRE